MKRDKHAKKPERDNSGFIRANHCHPENISACFAYFADYFVMLDSHDLLRDRRLRQSLSARNILSRERTGKAEKLWMVPYVFFLTLPLRFYFFASMFDFDPDRVGTNRSHRLQAKSQCIILREEMLMKFMQRFIHIIDTMNEKIGSGVAWLTTVMVLIVCYDVFTRYILHSSSVAIQELEWHLFAIIFLMAAAYTLKDDQHVRVDVLYTRFSPKVQAWINLLGSLIFLLPFCILVIWTSWNFVNQSFSMREGSPNPGGLPARYLLKAVIPVSFSFLFLQGLSMIFKSILTLTGFNTQERSA